MQEEKKNAGKEIKGGDSNLYVLGHEIGQTETKWKEIDDGSGKSQVKPEQKR